MFRSAMVVAGLVLGLAAVGMGPAPDAAADPIDYVMVLDDEGVYYESISDVIDLGKFTCRMLRSGAPVPAALNNAASAGYAPYETGIIVYSAGANMCPDVLPDIESWARSGNGGAATAAY